MLSSTVLMHETNITTFLPCSFLFLKPTSCISDGSHWLLPIICPNHICSLLGVRSHYEKVLDPWEMVLGSSCSSQQELKYTWIRCSQSFSVFASLTFLQCSCKPHLERPFAQMLHSKYRLASLNHLPLTSCPRYLLPLWNRHEWSPKHDFGHDFSHYFWLSHRPSLVPKVERRRSNIKAEDPSVPFKF